jgi:hypothetical protein
MVKIENLNDNILVSYEKPEKDDNWNILNTNILKINGSHYDNSNNKWVIPSSEQSKLSDVLNSFSKLNDTNDIKFDAIDDDNDDADFDSTEIIDEPFFKKSRDLSLDRKKSMDIKLSTDSKISRFSYNEKTEKEIEKEFDPYDVTNDSRIQQVKKYLLDKPFKYYLKHQLTRDEFDYLLKL